MGEQHTAGEDIGRALREATGLIAKAIADAGDAAADALSGAASRGGLVLHDPSIESDVLAHIGHDEPAASGADVQVRVHVDNPGDTATEPFRLRSVALKSGKQTIPASAVTPPDHDRVIAAGSSDHVPVIVSVPAGTKPGVYTGKLRGGPKPAELRLEVG